MVCVEAKGPDDAFVYPYPLGFLSRTYRLKKFQDLPPFLQHNEFIRTSYRSEINFSDCAKSLFHMHNETLCIWTHLIGYVMFIVELYHVLTSATLSTADQVFLFAYCVCVQLQMLFSTLFHLFHCHSISVYTLTVKLDYAGILFVICGSFYQPLYRLFLCKPHIYTFYMGGITVLGLLGAFVVYTPRFSEPRYHKYRAGTFVLMAAWAIFPIPHTIVEHGWSVGLPLVVRLSAVCLTYFVGCLFYVTRWPERQFPSMLSDCGTHSHIIWHLFVILGAYVHLRTMETLPYVLDSACLLA